MDLNIEQLITHRLLLLSSMEKDIGLFHGKMGLILFFAHYFKQTGLTVYNDTADELMEELIEDIHEDLPVGLTSGLSGIGWGIEYLIQNGFLEGDSLEICREIDKKIMERDPRRISDYSLDTGLEGLLHYVLMHIKSVIAQHSKPPFDTVYLSDLYQAVTKVPHDAEVSENFNRLSSKYAAWVENRTAFDYSLQLSSIIEDSIGMAHNNLSVPPLGLKGLSGFLLNKIL